MSSLREQAKSLEFKNSKGISNFCMPACTRANRATDYDPEDDAHQSEDEEDSDFEDETIGETGREHYESVGKSKLRKPVEPALGARYGGVAVSRKELEAQDDGEDNMFPASDDDEDDDDPFAPKIGSPGDIGEISVPSDMEDTAEIEEDDEINSDEALGESDVERFKNFAFRGSKINSRSEYNGNESDEEDEEGLDDDRSTEGSEGSDPDSDVDMDDEDEDEDEDQDDESNASSVSPPSSRKPMSSRSLAREELRKAATSSSSTAALASALSAGANADVKKGHAVKQQQQTFDRLLDARIKLQRGLTLASDLPTAAVVEDDLKAAAQQAEDAALALWSTIDSIRCSFTAAQQDASKTNTGRPGLKRKRPLAATRNTPTSELWQQTTSLDSTFRPLHRATLDKWNTKTQPVIDTTPQSRLLQGTKAHSSRLTEVLDTYLATTGPTLIESSTGTNTPLSSLYDDGPFYQSLLRSLIASRASGADSSSSAAANGDTTYLPPKLHVSGSRAKKVDTKASKGRKVRYTVHEKLQDFMAVEDRATWEDAAKREFFASLFGNRGVLDEVDGGDGDGDDGDGEGDENENGDGKEEVALRLFRN